MYKTTTVERPYSKEDVAMAKKLVAKIKAAKKDPGFVKAARAFYRQHTGEELAVSD